MNGYRKIILPEDKTITERYDIEQVNGQRIITLKNIPSIEHLVDTEIYISAIPRDCTEFHLVPIFEKHPKLLEFRLMMEFSGQNRGYSFAKYATPEQAATAVKIFSGMIIGKYRIDVSLSLNNRKLLIYDLPPAESLPTKVIEQTLQENTPLVKSVTEGSDGSAPGPRRDLIVEYQTHRAAAMARKTLLAPGGFHIGPHIIQVDWAIPDCLVVKPNERENEQKAVVPYISRNNELRKVMKPTDIYRIMMPTEMCQVMKPFTEIRQIHGMRQVSTPSQILQIPASMDLQQKSLDICKIPFSVDRYNPENPVVSLNVLARPNSTQALLHFAIHGSSVPRFITTKQRAPGTPLIAML